MWIARRNDEAFWYGRAAMMRFGNIEPDADGGPLQARRLRI